MKCNASKYFPKKPRFWNSYHWAAQIAVVGFFRGSVLRIVGTHGAKAVACEVRDDASVSGEIMAIANFADCFVSTIFSFFWLQWWLILC